MGRTIIVNGIKHEGDNIQIRNKKVIIDGKNVTPENTLIVNILVEGNVQSLQVDEAEKVAIAGHAGSVTTMSGSVEVRQDVEGKVESVSGSVRVGGNVHKSVQTTSGSVRVSGSVGGDVTTVSGSIRKK